MEKIFLRIRSPNNVIRNAFITEKDNCIRLFIIFNKTSFKQLDSIIGDDFIRFHFDPLKQTSVWTPEKGSPESDTVQINKRGIGKAKYTIDIYPGYCKYRFFI